MYQTTMYLLHKYIYAYMKSSHEFTCIYRGSPQIIIIVTSYLIIII